MPSWASLNSVFKVKCQGHIHSENASKTLSRKYGSQDAILLIDICTNINNTEKLITEWLDSVAQNAAKVLFEMLFIASLHDNDLTDFSCLTMHFYHLFYLKLCLNSCVKMVLRNDHTLM